MGESEHLVLPVGRLHRRRDHRISEATAAQATPARFSETLRAGEATVA